MTLLAALALGAVLAIPFVTGLLNALLELFFRLFLVLLELRVIELLGVLVLLACGLIIMDVVLNHFGSPNGLGAIDAPGFAPVTVSTWGLTRPGRWMCVITLVFWAAGFLGDRNAFLVVAAVLAGIYPAWRAARAAPAAALREE